MRFSVFEKVYRDHDQGHANRGGVAQGHRGGKWNQGDSDKPKKKGDRSADASHQMRFQVSGFKRMMTKKKPTDQ